MQHNIGTSRNLIFTANDSGGTETVLGLIEGLLHNRKTCLYFIKFLSVATD